MRTHDRQVLEEVIFRDLYRRSGVRTILFVGCSAYTQWYSSLFEHRRGTSFITVDPDQSVARFGAPGAHHVGRVEDLALAAGSVDTVILNGVFEYGTSTSDERDLVIDASHRLLRPEGILIVGYRDGSAGRDVELSDICARGFELMTIPGLQGPTLQTSASNGHAFAAFERTQ